MNKSGFLGTAVPHTEAGVLGADTVRGPPRPFPAFSPVHPPVGRELSSPDGVRLAGSSSRGSARSSPLAHILPKSGPQISQHILSIPLCFPWPVAEVMSASDVLALPGACQCRALPCSCVCPLRSLSFQPLLPSCRTSAKMAAF